MATMRIVNDQAKPLPRAAGRGPQRPASRWARVLPVGAAALLGLSLFCSARASMRTEPTRQAPAAVTQQVTMGRGAPVRKASMQAPMLPPPPRAAAAKAAGR